ncbi:hypothetical protein H7X69_03330 [Candidatus Saccharibacteria bacterium]|nr:hypothetical protein [Candidatus Saccharibacteria bacterium]
MMIIANLKRLTNKLVKDKNNNVVILQFPNLPLIGWFVLILFAQFVPSGLLKTGFENLSSALLFVWAYLEITQGASYARRLLGVVVITVVISGYFRT